MLDVMVLAVCVSAFGCSPIWLSIMISKEKAERYADWFNDTLGA